MFKSRKAQQALEFMIILVFSLTLIAIAMYVSGIFLTGMQEQDKADTVKNFVDSINKEISILNKVEGGYYRELELVSSRYDVNITPDLLIIKDLEDGNKTYYYDLAGGDSFIVKKINRDGIILITFQKGSNDFYEGLSLEENGTDISEEIYSFTVGSLSSTIVNSDTCPIDYIPLFRFNKNFFSSGHGQLSSITAPNAYNWTSCIKHDTYTLTTPSSCIDRNRLFYLGDETLSHLWTDKSLAIAAPYPGYYSWKEICMESSSNYVHIDYSTSDLSSDDYLCVGSYYTSDMSMGATLGDCSDYTPAYTKIWVKINSTPSPLDCPPILNLVWDADRTEFTPLVDPTPPGLLPNGNPWCYYQITNGDTYCGSWDRITGTRFMTGKCCGNLDYNKAINGGDC